MTWLTINHLVQMIPVSNFQIPIPEVKPELKIVNFVL